MSVNSHVGNRMNKHQVKGAANEAAGKIQKGVGRATGNGTQEIKGAARELAGKAEKSYGDVKSDLRKQDRREEREERQGR